jgi:Putative peptidoglycan binding domain
MSEENFPVSTTATPGSESAEPTTAETVHNASESGAQGGQPDPRDDWLGSTAELDWFEEDPSGSPSGGSGRGWGRGGTGGGLDEDALVRRRRITAAIVAAVILVVVVVGVIYAFGGGGSSNPTTTPPPTTTPTTGGSSSTGGSSTTGTTTPPSHTTKPSTTAHVKLPPSGHLKSGDTGAEVKTLQKALAELDAAGLKADGVYGPLTEQAVMSFQTAHGLTADGIVGPETAAAINKALEQSG